MPETPKANPEIAAALARLSELRQNQDIPDRVSAPAGKTPTLRKAGGVSDVDAAAKQLDALRGHRVWPERAEAVGVGMGSAKRELSRKARASGSIGEAWGELAPTEFRDRAGPMGVVRGVLTIGVDDSSTRFVVDRWLRSGGRDALAKASGSPFHRVKLVLSSTS